MIVSNAAVRNRITVFVLTVVVVLAGGYAYWSLPREAAPDINLPNVFVSTFYRGVSPRDIEKNITIEIEKKLKGLDGVKKISSVSAEGLSSINVEFITEMDIDQALSDVKDKLDLADPELPKDLDEEPVATEINFSEMPILVLTLSGTVGMRRLTHLAEDLEEEIEGVPGVLEVDIIGGVEREIQIQVRPERLTLYGISFGQLQGLVASENQNVSGGFIRTREGRYQLRVPGEFETVEDVEALVVAVHDGEPIYLRDIATVVDGLKDRESYARMNGRDAVTLQVRKRAGENIVRIVDDVLALIERTRSAWPPGTDIVKVDDRAKEIRTMVADLENNIVTGLLLVVLVVCLAMGLRNAILVSLSIPLSMLLSFIILQMLGITLNMVVLFSLTLALGMLVDNAIVIVENIYRFMQQGVPKEEAAMRATGEVAWPIIGSALTTIGAFVPLLWWTGIMGEFMIFLPKTVIIALSSCLFVALVINPALAVALMRADAKGKTATADEVMAGGEHPMLSGGGAVLTGYRWVVRHALRLRLAVVAAAGLLLVIMVLVWLLRAGIRTPMEFFPSIDPPRGYVNVKLPQGADLTYADGLVREIACRIFDEEAAAQGEKRTGAKRKSYEECLHFRERTGKSTGETYRSPSFLPDVEYVTEAASVAANAGAAFQQGADNQVAVMFADLEDRHVRSTETVQAMGALVEDIPGAEITVEKPQEGPPTGAPINIEIAGHDFEVLGKTADRVRDVVKQIPFVQNVRHDFERGSPTLRIQVDRKRAGLLGLSTQDIGFAIKAAINGVEVSTWRESDDDYDIMVQFQDADRKRIETLRRVFLPTPTHGEVPLTTVATIVYTGGFGQITRIDHKRVVTVQADVDETKTTGVTARMEAEKRVAELEMPAGVDYTFTGENEFQQESQDFLGWAMAVALVLIIFILVAQFNSITRPLIIMSAVMLSFGGVFLGLAVLGMPFGLIMTGVGAISLAGVVVNNAIVLVDYTDQLRDRGLPLEDAILAAGATRLRPVLLTAITTILSLIPMVTGVSLDFHPLLELRLPEVVWASESSQWWRSMAIAVIFGLGFATMMTLVVVPTLYHLFHHLRAVLRWGGAGLVHRWWAIYDRRRGTTYAERWRLSYADAVDGLESNRSDT